MVMFSALIINLTANLFSKLSAQVPKAIAGVTGTNLNRAFIHKWLALEAILIQGSVEYPVTTSCPELDDV